MQQIKHFSLKLNVLPYVLVEKNNRMKHLTLTQRHALNAYLQCGKTKSEISTLLNVNRSTVYIAQT